MADTDRVNALHCARTGDCKGLLQLIQKGVVLQDIKNKHGNLAYLAVMHDQPGILQILAHICGSKIVEGSKDHVESNLAWMAVQNESPECLQVIYAIRGREYLTGTYGTAKDTLAHHAAKMSQCLCVKMLAQCMGVKFLTAPNAKGNTPAHLAIGYPHRHNGVNFLEELCEIGAQNSFDIPNIATYTPLHDATAYGQLDAMKILLREGCSPYKTTQDGDTVAHTACKHDHSVPLQLLINSVGGNLVTVSNNAYLTPAHVAAQCGYTACLQIIVESCGQHELMRGDSHGWAVATHAAASGHLGVLQYLQSLNCIQALWVQDDDNHTPLDVAVASEKMACVEFLQTTLGMHDANGNTVAHCAASRGWLRVLSHLQTRRMLHTMCQEKNNNDLTVIQLAKQHGQEEAVQFILECDESEVLAGAPQSAEQRRRELRAALKHKIDNRMRRR